MKLENYLDRDHLTSLIDGGFVSVREHDAFPLRILNYTKKAQSIRNTNWPDALTKARGLIIDSEENIVSFGMRKFWNYDPAVDIIDGPVAAFDKLDGSLGVAYLWDGFAYIATRGSFHSEMAEWANEFLLAHPAYEEALRFTMERSSDNDGTPTFTPHVEIIYGDNRIVVEYDYEDLVLLGSNTAHDWFPAGEHDPFVWPGRKAKLYRFDSITDLVQSEYRPNTEGFVMQSENGMFKFKYEQYLDLHRAVSNMTERAIYNKMLVGEANDFILSLPDEFQAEANQIHVGLKLQYLRLKGDAFNAYYAIYREGQTRKEFAERAQAQPEYLRRYLFLMLDKDENKLHEALLKGIHP